MYTKDLIKRISEETGVSQKTVEEVLGQFSNTVTEAVKSGEEVSMRGFITFKPKETKARQGRNPQTGEPIAIPAKRTVSISAGKSLKAALNA